ncbi:hypothetical protein ACFLWU_01635 [Chloroflexota bacterium]
MRKTKLYTLGRILMIAGATLLLLEALFNTSPIVETIRSLAVRELAQENNGWLMLIGSVLVIVAVVILILHHPPEDSEDQSPEVDTH